MEKPTENELYYALKDCCIADSHALGAAYEGDTPLSWNGDHSIYLFECKELDGFVVVFREPQGISEWMRNPYFGEDPFQELIKSASATPYQLLKYLVTALHKKVIVTGFFKAAITAAIFTSNFLEATPKFGERKLLKCITFGIALVESLPKPIKQNLKQARHYLHHVLLEADAVPFVLLAACGRLEIPNLVDAIVCLQQILDSEKPHHRDVSKLMAVLEEISTKLPERYKVPLWKHSQKYLWRFGERNEKIELYLCEFVEEVSTTTKKVLENLINAPSKETRLKQHNLASYACVLNDIERPPTQEESKTQMPYIIRVKSVAVTPVLHNEGYFLEVIVEGTNLAIAHECQVEINNFHASIPIDISSPHAGALQLSVPIKDLNAVKNVSGKLTLHTIIGDLVCKVNPEDIAQELVTDLQPSRTDQCSPMLLVASSFLFCLSNICFPGPGSTISETEIYQHDSVMQIISTLDKMLDNVPLDTCLENLEELLAENEEPELRMAAIEVIRKSLKRHKRQHDKFPVSSRAFAYINGEPSCAALVPRLEVNNSRQFLDHRWKLTSGEQNIISSIFRAAIDRPGSVDDTLAWIHAEWRVWCAFIALYYEGKEYVRMPTGIFTSLLPTKLRKESALMGYQEKVFYCSSLAKVPDEYAAFVREDYLSNSWDTARCKNKEWLEYMKIQIQLVNKLRHTLVEVNSSIGIFTHSGIPPIPVQAMFREPPKSDFPQAIKVSDRQKTDSSVAIFPLDFDSKSLLYVDTILPFLDHFVVVLDVNSLHECASAFSVIHQELLHRVDVVVLIYCKEWTKSEFKKYCEFELKITKALRKDVANDLIIDTNFNIFPLEYSFDTFESPQIWNLRNLRKWVRNRVLEDNEEGEEEDDDFAQDGNSGSSFSINNISGITQRTQDDGNTSYNSALSDIHKWTSEQAGVDEDEEQEDGDIDSIFVDDTADSGQTDSINNARVTGESSLSRLLYSVKKDRPNHSTDTAQESVNGDDKENHSHGSANDENSINGTPAKTTILEETVTEEAYVAEEELIDDSDDDGEEGGEGDGETEEEIITPSVSGNTTMSSNDGEVSINTSKIDRSHIIRSASKKNKGGRASLPATTRSASKRERGPSFFPFPDTPTPKKVRFSDAHQPK